MYRYQSTVDYLQTQGAKPSAELLNKIFFELIIKKYPCNWFIEAGAFEATASSLVKEKLPNCQVYAFEANPDHYSHFKDNLQTINYVHQAISNYSGMIVFKQQATGSNGIVFPKVRGNNSVKSRTLDKETVYNNIEVSCNTLENMFDAQILPQQTAAVWIDLEGVAYEALQASTKLFDRVSFVKVEVEDKQYWENQKLSTDIIDLMSAYGMTALIRDFEMVSVAQYNILFANNNLITPELDKFFEEYANV